VSSSGSATGDRKRRTVFRTIPDLRSNDPEFLDIVATGGRAAQDEALRNPGFYDLETEDLYSWAETEVANRELQPPIEKAAAPAKTPKSPPRKGNGSKRQEGRA
jgi:hypothetical protein